VRNTEGGTKVGHGKPAGEWTPGTYVAKEKENPKEGVRWLRPAGRFEAVNYFVEEAKLTRG
jgi:hypothetical protein